MYKQEWVNQHAAKTRGEAKVILTPDQFLQVRDRD
jgi:hypothetical protein